MQCNTRGGKTRLSKPNRRRRCRCISSSGSGSGTWNKHVYAACPHLKCNRVSTAALAFALCVHHALPVEGLAGRCASLKRERKRPGPKLLHPTTLGSDVLRDWFGLRCHERGQPWGVGLAWHGMAWAWARARAWVYLSFVAMWTRGCCA